MYCGNGRCACRNGYTWMSGLPNLEDDCYKKCQTVKDCPISSDDQNRYSCDGGICCQLPPTDDLLAMVCTFSILILIIGTLVGTITAWRSRKLHKPVIYGNFKLQSQLQS